MPSDWFADTSGYIALWDRRNPTLQSAVRSIFNQARQRRTLFITTSYIIDELVAWMIGRIPYQQIVHLIDDLRQSLWTKIIFVNESLEQRGWQLFKSRPDKFWSLTDCISFIVMGDLGLSEAFTIDHHFRQAGFIPLLPTG